jgi:hypothetical protein
MGAGLDLFEEVVFLAEVEEHEIKRQLSEVVIVPEHAQRKESAEFKRSKERLKADGHFKCYVSGRTEKLQVHHISEWCFANVIDFDKLKEFLLEFDPYGYSRLLRNAPITTPDDVRNCLVIAEEFHIGRGTGIHELTWPVWLVQKLAKAGEDPVPEPGETVEQVEKEIAQLGG